MDQLQRLRMAVAGLLVAVVVLFAVHAWDTVRLASLESKIKSILLEQSPRRVAQTKETVETVETVAIPGGDFLSQVAENNRFYEEAIFAKGIPQDIVFSSELAASRVYEAKLVSMGAQAKRTHMSLDQRHQVFPTLENDHRTAVRRMRESWYRQPYTPRWSY
jgi:hypothetical protein